MIELIIQISELYCRIVLLTFGLGFVYNEAVGNTSWFYRTAKHIFTSLVWMGLFIINFVAMTSLTIYQWIVT